MKKQWLIVAASFCGLFIGAGTMTYVLAVFLPVVTQSLGISRGTFSTGILLYTLVVAVACPFLGAALDRWGSRKVLPPLIAGFAACTAAFSLLQPNVPMLMGLFAISGIAALGLTAVPFARAVSLWFEEHRGLALGVAIAGQGFGVAILPQAVGRIIAAEGWRTAYVVYGAAMLVIALLPVAIFLREPSKPDAARADAAAPPRLELTGVAASEALKSWRFWAMSVAFFFGIVAINGTISHMVALLADRGMTMPDAIRSITAVGMAAIVGRLACGWLLDRLPSTQVALIFFGAPVIGIQFIASGGVGALPLVGAALLGFSIGGEVDMLAFFTGRYFGMKAFGRIYGLMFTLFSAGSGVGPFISGKAFDAFHSYAAAFVVFQVILVLGFLLVSRLGPYRFVSGRHAGASTASRPATITVPTTPRMNLK